MSQTIEQYQAGRASEINAHIASGGSVELLRVLNDQGDVKWVKVVRAVPEGGKIRLVLTDGERSIGTFNNDSFTLSWSSAVLREEKPVTGTVPC